MKPILFYIGLLLFVSCVNNKTEKEETSKDDHSHHVISSLATGYSDSINLGLIKEDTLKGSPPRTAMATVKNTHVHIQYNSPGVKDRIVWGGLVPYDKVWVTGAHTATSVHFYKEVIINNEKVAAGKYALFTIPGKEEWTVILNKNYNQHLTDDYDEKEDVLRVKIKPEQHTFIHRLTYAVEETENNDGVINILWEKIKISIPFKTID